MSSSPSRRIPGWPASRLCLRGSFSPPCAADLRRAGSCVSGRTHTKCPTPICGPLSRRSRPFPDATGWLIGQSDLLLVASTQSLDSNFKNLERGWTRSGVAADLATVSAVEPFAFWSLFATGPQALKSYASGAVLQNDNRMAVRLRLGLGRLLCTAYCRTLGLGFHAHNYQQH
jgi:hypothetical protein